ncbi:hypothetical protein SAMN04488597_1311, partial [Halanaerobium congolense]
GMIGRKQNISNWNKVGQKSLKDNGSIQKDSSKEVIIGVIGIKQEE